MVCPSAWRPNFKIRRKHYDFWTHHEFDETIHCVKIARYIASPLNFDFVKVKAVSQWFINLRCCCCSIDREVKTYDRDMSV